MNKIAKRTLALALSATLSLSLLTSCGGKESADSGSDTVKIAVAGPMTGDNSEYGIGFYNAATMMADQWNEEGGVLGRQIEVVQYDDKNSAEEAASIAQKISAEDDIVGVIGHFASGVCLVAAPVYQENGIIEISPTAGHVDYSGIGDYIFRNNSLVSLEAASILDIAINDMGGKNVGIIAIQTDWGQSTSDMIEEMMASEYPDVNMVAREDVMEGSDDYSPAITKLDAAGADVVICTGMYSLVGPVAKQYKQINPDIQIAAFSNSYSNELIALGGEAVNGVTFPVSFFSQSEEPMIQDYVADYTERYGTEPSALTSQAYDSMGMLLTAIEDAGTTDREAVRDALFDVSFQGVTGLNECNDIGDVMKDFTKVTIKDGVFVTAS